MSSSYTFTYQSPDCVSGNVNSNLESFSVLLSNSAVCFECNRFETQRWQIILLFVLVFVKLSGDRHDFILTQAIP
jgi:hypothetical protein